MAHTSKKKNTPVEGLRRKKIEQEATPREHISKRAIRPNERKEHDKGTKNPNDKTGKVEK